MITSAVIYDKLMLFCFVILFQL